MERRFTGLVFPILIAVLVWMLFFNKKDPQQPKVVLDPAASDPVVQKAIEAQPQHEFQPVDYVKHKFGELDDKGYQVVWSRYGAGVRSITLNDHYVSPDAAKKPELELADYYPIVPDYGPGPRDWKYGLVLEGRGMTRFAKAIDDGPNLQLWDAEEKDDTVVFSLDMEDGLVLEKVFSYEPDTRDLKLEIRLRRVSDRPAGAPTAPTEYGVRLRGVHLWNPYQERVFQNPAVAAGSYVAPDGTQLPNRWIPVAAGNQPLLPPPDAPMGSEFQFAGTTNRFFGGFLFPDPEDPAARAAVTGVGCRSWPPAERPVGDHFKIEAGSVPEVYLDLTLAVPKKKDATTSLHYRLYLGPKSSSVFAGDYAQFEVVMDGDLTTPCCCIPGLQSLARGIIWLLTGFYGLVGNWGVAIIMLTLVVRILLSPLNFNMQRTMRHHGAKMTKLKPEMDALQKRYKDDPKKLQQEMMKFNKEHKLLSAPLKGCLPIFVTMPIWFGLFTALRVMYELRGQGFVGYIDDLSKPDRLFQLGWDLGIVEIPYFNLLPILMVALWFYLQMGTPLPKDPQQRQMMVMMRFMPLIMGVVLFNYASGLMIYMCTSSVWGIVEQKVTKSILGPVNPDAAGPGTMPMM